MINSFIFQYYSVLWGIMSNNKHILGRVQVTRECNQDCVFCSAPPAEEDLKFDEIKEKVLELKELGTTDLMITGGEPTLRKDLFEIIEYAKTLNFTEITIQSNGYNLKDRKFLEDLRQIFPVKFNISYHSCDPEVACKISGNKRHFEGLMQGLDNAHALGMNVYPTIVICSLNYETLPEMVKYWHERFPNYTHVSINYIDPIYKALDNEWIVPKYVDTEKYMKQMADYMLSNGMTFRLERVPLCYMKGFEHLSSDIRRGIFDESRIISFLRVEGDNEEDGINIEKESNFKYAEACKECSLKDLCRGINPNYIAVHGDSEAEPSSEDPDKIVAKVKGSKTLVKNENDLQKLVEADLKLFKHAIDIKSNKNNIYDTYSFYLTSHLGIKDRKFIRKAWEHHLRKVSAGKEKDLLCFYIHIPYCVSNCDYCVYPSTTLADEEQIEKYLQFLLSEMDEFKDLFKGFKFRTLYLGGGTPSVFSAEQLERLFSKLFDNYEFHQYAELAMELNPRNGTYEKLKVLEKYSFNKISIGVQSLCPDVLKQNGRGYQTEEMVEEFAKNFKKLDLKYLNMDMVMGLKGDTPEKFLESFEKICKLDPTNICIYPLKTNDEYLKRYYDGKFENFKEFYYPLFDKITEVITDIAESYDYIPYYEKDKIGYISPLIFAKKGANRKEVKYSYSHFSQEGFSNFCLGFFSHSRITNMIDYIYLDQNNQDTMFLKHMSSNPEDYVYFVNSFSNRFERVKFIVQEFYKHRRVPRKTYQDLYGTDILSDFPYALSAFKALNLIEKIDETEVVFKNIDEKEAYAYMLFFAGRKNVLRRVHGL